MTEYNPKMPVNCYPLLGIPGTKKIFRLGSKSVVPDDVAIKSYFERGKASDLSNCNCYGLSIWTEERAVRHAQNVLRGFLKNKVIFQAEVNDNDGCVRHTPSIQQPEHHTFWVKNSCQIGHKLSVHGQLTSEGKSA